MSKGLDYFKKVYDTVPGWVQKMHDYNPDMLDHYTALRSAAMSAGALSVKEKDILLVGMNAGRFYARSMVYHTKGAIDGGATLEELIEYLVVPYLVGGVQALQIGLQSFEYACEYKGEKAAAIPHTSSAKDILVYYQQHTREKAYLQRALEVMDEENETALTDALLQSAHVSAKMKHLLMTGCYTARLQNAETEEWAKKTRALGVEEAKLAELGYTCLLTAGIPAWFEISDALIAK